jgi:hypothetical protein
LCFPAIILPSQSQQECKPIKLYGHNYWSR